MDKLLKRKVDNYLLEWKNNPRRKPLILNGARQVGKTWLLKHFGETSSTTPRIHSYQEKLQKAMSKVYRKTEK